MSVLKILLRKSTKSPNLLDETSTDFMHFHESTSTNMRSISLSPENNQNAIVAWKTGSDVVYICLHLRKQELQNTSNFVGSVQNWNKLLDFH